jgi:hypothetical protein
MRITMKKPFRPVPIWRSIALALSFVLCACGGLPLEDLKTSEFRVVRVAQKPLWTYSQCLAERLTSLRGGSVVSHKLTLTVNITKTGIELMSRDPKPDSDALNYWYFVDVRPIDEGVRTSAWVCGCFNRPSPREMLAWIDDAIQICGSVSV